METIKFNVSLSKRCMTVCPHGMTSMHTNNIIKAGSFVCFGCEHNSCIDHEKREVKCSCEEDRLHTVIKKDNNPKEHKINYPDSFRVFDTHLKGKKNTLKRDNITKLLIDDSFKMGGMHSTSGCFRWLKNSNGWKLTWGRKSHSKSKKYFSMYKYFKTEFELRKYLAKIECALSFINIGFVVE